MTNTNLVLIWNQTGKRFKIDRFPVRIGRDPGADVVINDPCVSRRHARIDQQGGKLFLVDLGSTNGVFTGRQKIVRVVEIRIGENFRLGDQGPQLLLRTARVQKQPKAQKAKPEGAKRPMQVSPKKHPAVIWAHRTGACSRDCPSWGTINVCPCLKVYNLWQASKR